MAANTALFEPLDFGRTILKTRIAMSPMSRHRATDQHVQRPYVKDYYGQRASEGSLIICENTAVSLQASGLANAPGIWTPEQVAAWKGVVDAVHAKGGVIFLQLCALGRVADPALRKPEYGLDIFSASDIPMSQGSVIPRPLSEEEISELVQDFVKAARNAVDGAGFDGVEIHGAYGYLLDQFTQDVSNRRTDSFGGSVDHRSRLPLAVVRAVADVVGADRVGYRMSPWSTFQGMGMVNPVPQFTHLITGLADLGICYLHLILDRGSGGEASSGLDAKSKSIIDFALDAWGHDRPVLLAGGSTAQSAMATVENVLKGRPIVIVIARWFTSNPDLVYRIKHGVEFSPYDRSTFYTGGEKGYVDQKYSQQFLQETVA